MPVAHFTTTTAVTRKEKKIQHGTRMRNKIVTFLRGIIGLYHYVCWGKYSRKVKKKMIPTTFVMRGGGMSFYFEVVVGICVENRCVCVCGWVSGCVWGWIFVTK